MTTNKKLVVTVGVMAVALILALTGLIVVLVTVNQRASSAVNVKYTSSDVAVTLSATAYLGRNSHVFTKGGVVDGETELVLSPTVTEGSLSQTSDIASFDLTKTNDYIVFEYVFANNTDTIDVKIDQDGVPATRENIDLTYTYSDTKITNFGELEDNAEFTAQLLPAYVGEETVKYVYIKAQIADLLYDSSLVGDFGWALSKPQDSEVNTITLNVANADYIERTGSNLNSTEITGNYTYKTFATTIDAEDITLVPAEVDKAFIGWSETEGGTVISAITMPSADTTHNTLRGTTAKTLYPVYKDGNVNMSTTASSATATGLTDTSSTEAVIPDITLHEGSIVKVTSIGGSAFGGCTGLTSITIPDSVTSLGMEAFYDCTGLTSITIPKGVTFLPGFCFHNCSSLTSITIPDSVIEIGFGDFCGCTSLTSITIPSSVVRIVESAFQGCSSLTSITIPSSVTSIGDNAFLECEGLLSVNGGSGITFEDTKGWTCDGFAIDVTNSYTNAINMTTFDDDWKVKGLLKQS